MPDIPQNRIGDYQRLQLLGAGGQGRVFRAVCVVSGNPRVPHGEVVAIKILHRQVSDESAIERQQRQSEALQILVHPNIVRYKDCFFKREGEWDEELCLVMELLEGDDLKSILKETPTGLPWERGRAIIEQCLEGLAYARNQGIFHRDLKPSNITIIPDGSVKLIDFGIAHVDDGGSTSTGAFKGTFDYMAPDFVLIAHLDNYEPCDIFSLGVCFYQILTGNLPYPPFTGNAPIGFVTRWQGGRAPEISFKHKVFRVYPQARSFIQKCLAVRREDRYQTFDEMLAALRAIRPRTIRHRDGDTYECVEWVGRGGFGEVYRAKRVRDGRSVAVKYLVSAQSSPQRFIKEARLIKGFHHPHIVEYVDFLQMDRADGSRDFFLVLEFLEGMPDSSLRGRLKKSPQGLPPAEVLKLFEGYLEALHYLHVGNGQDVIVHRDIKPSNLYAPDGAPENAKVFDLGVARDVHGTATAGMIPGTLDYMAPELAGGDDRGTPQSDIYSLGLCLYEALTGSPVFPPLPRAEKEAWPKFIERSKGSIRLDFSHAVFREFPVLTDIVRRALEPKPKRRFSSAQAMYLELEEALAALRPRPASTPEPVSGPDSDEVAVSPELETRMGDDGQNTDGLVLTKSARTEAPVELGTSGGTTIGSLGIGTRTVAPTPGTIAGGGLESRFEAFRARRGKRRRLVGVGLAVGLAIALTGGAFWLAGAISRSPVESAMAFLEDAPHTKPTAAYVTALAERQVELTAVTHPDDRVLRCRTKLDEIAAGLPAMFSNEMAVALLELQRGNAKPADLLGKALNAARGKAMARGWAAAELDALQSQFEKEKNRIDDDRKIGELQKRLAPLIIPWTPNRAKDAESLLGDIEKGPNSRLDELRQLKAVLATNMQAFVQVSASKENAVGELERLPKDVPRLVALVQDGFDTALKEARADAVRRDNLKRESELRARAEEIATAAEFASSNELFNLREDYYRLEAEWGADDRDRAANALLAGCRRLAKEQAEAAIFDYEQDRFEDGERKRETWRGFLDRCGPWANDAEIQEWASRIESAHGRAMGLRAEREKNRREAIGKATAALKDLEDRATKIAPTNHVEASRAIKELLDLRASLAADIANDPEVAGEYSRAAAACRKALESVLTCRVGLSGRRDRIETVAGLLAGGTAERLEDSGSLVKILNGERKTFVFTVRNGSELEMTMKAGATGPKARVAPGQTSGLISLAGGDKPVSREVVFEAIEKGYQPQRVNVEVVGGGGAELVAAPFNMAPVEVQMGPSLPAASKPPVRSAYRQSGAQTWVDWPLGTALSLMPGQYELRFERSDFEAVDRPLAVPRASPPISIPAPKSDEWKPKPQLAALENMEGLKNKWVEIARMLAGADLKFEDPNHTGRYEQLKKSCGEQINALADRAIPAADQSVRDYCAYLYQVSDPQNNKVRRYSEAAPTLDLNEIQADFPVEAISDPTVRGQYRRFQAWQMDETMRRAELERLGADPELSRLDSRLAGRSRFEYELLGWDGSSAVADKADATEAEWYRWRAHAGYRVTGGVTDDLREGVGWLAQYRRMGGILDSYDLRLAVYEVYYCWDNYVVPAQTARELGKTDKARLKTVGSDSAYRAEVDSRASLAKEILANLKILLADADAEAVRKLALYLRTQHERGGRPANMMIRFLQSRSGEFSPIIARELRGIDLGPATEEDQVWLEVLADHLAVAI